MRTAVAGKVKDGAIKVAAIERIANEQEYRDNEIEIQRRCGHQLVDYMLELGCVKFDTTHEVCLCGCKGDNHEQNCPNHPHSTHPLGFAVRAIIAVKL